MIEYKIDSYKKYEQCLKYIEKGMDLKTILYHFGKISESNRKMIKCIYFDEYMKKYFDKIKNTSYYNIIPESLGVNYLDEFLDEYIDEKSDDVFIMNRIKPREFKDYLGEKNIFLYNFTGEKSDYRWTFRIMGNRYKYYFCSYNLPCMWEEVQMASPLPPEILEENMSKAENITSDLGFFMRRVDFVVLHYEFELNHEKIYRKYTQKGSEYIDYVHIRELAIRNDREYADYLSKL